MYRFSCKVEEYWGDESIEHRWVWNSCWCCSRCRINSSIYVTQKEFLRKWNE